MSNNIKKEWCYYKRDLDQACQKCNPTEIKKKKCHLYKERKESQKKYEEYCKNCKRCVHENGYDPNYPGSCENCVRNPKYSDFYIDRKEFEDLECKMCSYDREEDCSEGCMLLKSEEEDDGLDD